MIYSIYHSTRFYYHHGVGFSHNLVRLQPRNTPVQTLVGFNLTVEPGAAEIETYDDFFNNHLHHLLVREPHTVLNVVAESRVRLDADALEWREAKRQLAKNVTYAQAIEGLGILNAETIVARQFALCSPLLPFSSEALIAYAAESIRLERSLYEGVEEFIARIFHDFVFVSGFSDVNTPVETVFREKKGVCQDFAHLAITALRGLGLAVRYMSGYIETAPLPEADKLFGADASHAWISVFFPDHGWFEFDPTNNCVPYDQHILLGYGRDYRDIAPMQGVVVGSGTSHLGVMVDVRRVE